MKYIQFVPFSVPWLLKPTQTDTHTTSVRELEGEKRVF